MIQKGHFRNCLKPTLIVAALMLGACFSDDVEEVNPNGGGVANNSNIVTFGIDTSDKWEPDVIGDAEASADNAPQNGGGYFRSETFMMDCDKDDSPFGQQIYMYMIEEDYPAIDAESAVTRGEDSEGNEGDTTEDSEGDEGDNSTSSANSAAGNTRAVAVSDADLGIFAYMTTGSTTTVFMDNLRLFANDNTGATYGTEPKYWPGGGSSLKFFAYHPYIPATNGPEGLSVADKNGDAFSPMFTYTAPTVVAKQTDLKVGASSDINGSNTAQVAFSISHVLSQIKVKIGTMAVGTIKSVSIKGVKGTGTVTYDAPNSKFVAAPTADATATDYSQTNLDIDVQTPPADDAIGAPMYLVPQTLTDDAVIEIVLDVTSDLPEATTDVNGYPVTQRTNTYTLSSKLSQFKNAWASNKSYTYVITTPEEVKVNVDDEVVGNVKKNLTITNTGLSPAYMRAHIVGCWVVPDDPTKENPVYSVVRDWRPEEDGDFVWPGGSEPATDAPDGWRKGADGYYYYLPLVQPGAATAPLFTSYTLTAEPPQPGAWLEMTISVQAIIKDDMKYVWPDAEKTAAETLANTPNP